MVVYIVLYFVISAFAAIWTVGKIHGYEITRYTLVNNPPQEFAYGVAIVTFFCLPAVFITLRAYSDRKTKWVWPKKGVTYDKF